MVSVIVYPCRFCAALSMDLYRLGVVVIFLLNVWGVLHWIDRIWSSKDCVCDPSVHLDASSLNCVQSAFV